MKPAQAARLLQEAVGLQRRGRLDDAAALCEKIVARFPRVSEPMQLLGLVRMQQRRLEEAEHFLRESAALAPERAEFQSALGNVLAAREKTPEAEFVYQEALRLNPSFRPARLGLARLYNRVGLYSSAEEEARRLLLDQPDDARVLNALGVALQGQERLTEADEAFRRALKLEPGYGVARQHLGQLLGSLHRRYEALEQFDAAIEAGIDGPGIRTSRAQALLHLDRREEALATLEHIVAEHPTAISAHDLLARTRRDGGDSDFDRDLAAAARRFPASVALQRLYARVLCANGDPSVAADVLQDALRHGGPRAALLNALSEVQLLADDPEAALASAREACRAEPHDPTLRDAHIDALLAQGMFERAGELVAAGLRRSPQDLRYRALQATLAAESVGRIVDTPAIEAPEGWQSLGDFNDDLSSLIAGRHRFESPPLDNLLHAGTRAVHRLAGDSNPVLRGLNDLLDGALGKPADSRRIESILLPPNGYLRPQLRPRGRRAGVYCVAAPNSDTHWFELGRPPFAIPNAGKPRAMALSSGSLRLFDSACWLSATAISTHGPRLLLLFEAPIGEDRPE